MKQELIKLEEKKKKSKAGWSLWRSNPPVELTKEEL